MSGTTIDSDTVLRIADLAHLELADGDLGRMTEELGAIIGYISQLAEVDTTDVVPTAHLQLDRLPLRDDEPAPSLGREAAQAAAPDKSDEGFLVPSFVDEG